MTAKPALKNTLGADRKTFRYCNWETSFNQRTLQMPIKRNSAIGTGENTLYQRILQMLIIPLLEGYSRCWTGKLVCMEGYSRCWNGKLACMEGYSRCWTGKLSFITGHSRCWATDISLLGGVWSCTADSTTLRRHVTIRADDTAHATEQ